MTVCALLFMLLWIGFCVFVKVYFPNTPGAGAGVPILLAGFVIIMDGTADEKV